MNSPKFEFFSERIKELLKQKKDYKEIRNTLNSFREFETPSDLCFFINDKRILHFAVYYETVDVVRYLISLPDIDINLRFERRVGIFLNFWDSPLHIASRLGNIELCKLLISNGAEMNLFNRFKQMPVDVARTNETKMILRDENLKKKGQTIQKLTQFFSRRTKRKNERDVTFGVITDIHYGHLLPLRITFFKNTRHYNQSLYKTEVAMETFRRHGVDFVIHLGDLIDFRNLENSEENLKRIWNSLNKPKSDFPIFYAVGNHDAYHLTTEDFQNTISFHPDKLSLEKFRVSKGEETDSLYYFFDFKDTRFVVLDSMDISCFSSNSEKAELAYSTVKKRNPNGDIDAPYYLTKEKTKEQVDEFMNLNELKEEEKFNERFVYYTGGIGETQLKWIKKAVDTESLKSSNIQSVVVFSHLGILPGFPDLCSSKAVVWNWESVYSVFVKTQKSGVQVTVLFGHDHKGGLKSKFVDQHRIVHSCARGMIITPVESCFAICNLKTNGEEEEDGEVLQIHRFLSK